MIHPHRVSAGRAFVAALLLLTVSSAGGAVRPGAGPPARDAPRRSRAIFDNTARMDANNLDMFVTNHGSYAFDQTTSNAGLIFPRGSVNTVVFAAGPWIGALVNGQIRVAVGEYSQEFAPGPMLGGTYQPDQPRFKCYKIVRGNTTDPDYVNWPVVDGAPVDGNGEPLLLGDATIWSVYNDADPFLHTNNAGNTPPLGIEVQQTVFAFNRPGPLGNAIFFKFKLLNKGSNQLDQVFFSLWSDPDVGGFTDDLVACDTTLALGYAYNATNQDEQYGPTPPAVGFVMLQGPIVPADGGSTDTLGMTAFNKYINGTDPVSSSETYNYMRGLAANGDPIHVNDDSLAPITTFQVSGDPVTGTGWLDQHSADRRMNVCTGPFTMAPGDSQEIVAAVLVGHGGDRLASVTALREAALAVRDVYRNGFGLFAVTAPAARTVDEGALLAFEVMAQEPEGGPLVLSASGLPIGATFSDRGDGRGEFRWTPAFNQAGEHTVTFTARRADGEAVSANTRITVRNVNRAPIAVPGGPYSGFIGVPVSFDGTGSSDPDGDALAYQWSFGDGGSATGSSPAHAYASPGTYGVALTVSDGVASHVATTTASILGAFTARAFTTGGNPAIKLGSGKQSWCVQIEPVGRSFEVASVDPSSIVMKSEGTGSVDEIHAIGGKSTAVADRDGNGVKEIAACFAKADLRVLFSSVRGQASVPVTLEGDVLTGGFFRASITVSVQGGGGPSSVVAIPTVVDAHGAFEFATGRPGRVAIRLFDVAGRFVRTVYEERAATGWHRVEFDATNAQGERLPAGIYFYRAVLPEGDATGRIVVTR